MSGLGQRRQWPVHRYRAPTTLLRGYIGALLERTGKPRTVGRYTSPPEQNVAGGVHALAKAGQIDVEQAAVALAGAAVHEDAVDVAGVSGFDDRAVGTVHRDQV